jgi:hypothetical protein
MGAYVWSSLLGIFGWLVAVCESIWGMIGGVLLLALAWIANNFVVKPYLDFRNLKSQVRQELIFTANVGPMSRGTADYSNAVDSLRRLGTQVQVHPLGWYLRVCGYDLPKAGTGLVALSNSLSAYDDARTRHKNSVLTGLRLPPELL